MDPSATYTTSRDANYVPDDLARSIRQAAADTGLSVSATVTAALAHCFGRGGDGSGSVSP